MNNIGIYELPLELWGKISYFCNEHDFVNFIHYITSTMEKTTQNKKIIKYLILENINNNKLSRKIYNIYKNIDTINTYSIFISHYSELHQNIDFNNINKNINIIDFYTKLYYFYNTLKKKIPSQNKKKYCDICICIENKYKFFDENLMLNNVKFKNYNILLKYLSIVL